MDQKHIGIILLIVSVLIASFVVIVKKNNDDFADEYRRIQGDCYLDDGTCLHKKDTTIYVLGWGISLALFLFGTYLTFIDKTQEMMAEHQIKISSALESAKKQDREKDEFSAYLAGFNEKEQKIIKAIKEQDGIKQATLRYKTDISKTGLSLMLKDLEERKIISRKPYKKTNQVFLVKKF